MIDGKMSMLSSINAQRSTDERNARICEQYVALHSDDSTAIAKAKEDICCDYYGLVLQIAYKFANGTENPEQHMDDMVAQGMLGLLKALQDYNPAKGAFTTFAQFYVKHEIDDYLRTLYGTTQHYETLVVRLNKAMTALEHMGIITPTIQQIEDISGLSNAEIQKAMEAKRARQIRSLDYENGNENEDGIDRADIDFHSNPEHKYLQKERTEVIQTAISKLPDIERQCILMRYGFLGEPMKYSQMAQQLDMSESEVKKHTTEGRKKLCRDASMKRLFHYNTESVRYRISHTEIDIWQ